MNTIALCVATAMNIFSLPAGNTVVATIPAPVPPSRPFMVQILDTSMFRDWVFIGVPMGFGPVPIGWVPYASLASCPIAVEPGPDRSSAAQPLQR